MKATGWQAHSVRGFISGTIGKKLGRTVESSKPRGSWVTTLYRGALNEWPVIRPESDKIVGIEHR